MKKLIIVFSAILLIQYSVCAKIKNGYNSSVEEKEILLARLKEVLLENKKRNSKSMVKLTFPQKRKMKLQIDSLEQYIYYHNLTEELLGHFKLISWEIYRDINNIFNENGIETDVYVKFVPKGQMKVGQNAITLMYQKPNNKYVSFSEYGSHTVAVIIAADTKPLWLLAHEFGHIKYQVPNFSTYVEFYKKYYYYKYFKSSFIGHNDRDESGKIAMRFGQEYQKNYKVYRNKLKEYYRYQIALIN